MLASMRSEREGLSAREAVDCVLRDNLHGLEIDQRCVELAAFALGFAAWRYPGAGGYRMLPELNLACSGLSISASKEEWQNSLSAVIIVICEIVAWTGLYDQFKDAPRFGSLSNPKLTLVKAVEWGELPRYLLCS